ncbi:hypothetical protein CHAN_06875 [Corynebacterium hansenii]|nr:hypothetical protein CHAN_06875 [Corynebacterium hansenii]
MLRAATLAMACAWPLWQLERVLFNYPGTEWLRHWFPTVTVLVFAVPNLLMFVAWLIGRRDTMILANRIAGLSVPMAMLLVMIGIAQGDAGSQSAIWFTGFVGVPAVAFALTVPLQVGIPWFVFTVGGVTLANAVLQGRSQWDELAGDVGFALINTFAFIVFAAAAMRVSRVTDAFEARASGDHARAARMRARNKEMTRFTAHVHDHVLSELAAIAAGMKPSGTADLRFGSGLKGNGAIDVDEFIAMIAECVHRETPDCEVIVEKRGPTGAVDYPEQLIANLLPSLAEVARNSGEHAGPDALRRCELEVGGSELRVTYSDDGPGFCLDDVDDTRAGLRISVLGRMASVEGGSAVVRSAPGEGTEVTLHWAGDNPSAPQAPLPAGADDEPITSILGMDIVYSWQFGSGIVAVMALINFSGGNFLGWAELSSLALVAVGVALLMPGKGPRLPRARTAGLVVVAAILAGVGQWQEVVQTVWNWDRFIFLDMVALLASLVAIRGRPGGAGLMILSAATVVEVLRRTGASPAPDLTFLTVFLFSILVAAAALVNIGVRYFLRRLPEARADQMDAAAAAAAAREQKERRRENLAWLEHEIRPVIDAARVLDPATDRLRLRARLTELGLRDVLRSPLLDVPALRAAIWDARSRGVEVRLLDDRTSSRVNGEDGAVSFGEATSPEDSASAEDAASPESADDVDAPRAVVANLGQMIGALDRSEAGESVTIRLSPPHRDVFATISDASGVVRLAADGTRL